MAREDRINEFVELFTEHEPRVHAYVLSLVPSWSAAEDVLQETNAVLWAKFDEYESGTNFFAWACKIARLKVMEMRRRQGKSGVGLSEEVLARLESDTVRMSDELRGRSEALAHCLAKLADTERDLIRRRYAEDASVARLAAQSGRSVEAIYKAVSRIRKALHACITRRLRTEGGR